RSNVFFGAVVGMLVLWALRTEVTHGLVFHLSAVTAMTLMFGWSLSVIGGKGTILKDWLDVKAVAPACRFPPGRCFIV
ncbi:MAG: hypothetical protein R3311_19405, partial [Oceanisphaera sp.]|nr:hypothetical protein [Oceanisphaera sp.]